MTFPFDPTRGLIVVPTRVWGPHGDAVVRLALDTGATSTLVRSGILVAPGYDPAASADRVRVTTGSGVEFTPRVTLARLRALGVARKTFRILAHTLPPTASVDGVLGLDFLRRHRLSIDFRKGEVALD